MDVDDRQCLGLTRDVGPWIHTKVTAKFAVVFYSAIDLVKIPSPAFLAVYGSDSGPKTFAIDDGIVASIVHPKPKGRAE